MGLESIVSQIPVVGSILGPLLGAILKSENGAVRYTIRMGAGPKKDIDITYDKDKKTIELINRTDNPVIATFPAQNSYTGDMVLLDPVSSADVTTPFVNCTTNDIDSFEITTSLEDMKSRGANGETCLTLSSSGSVPTNGSAKLLGSYIKVKVEKTFNQQTQETEGWLTVSLVPEHTLQQVTHLYVESAEGNQEYQISNCMPDGGVVRVLLPSLSVKGAEVLVSVTVECLQSANLQAQNRAKYNVRPLTPEDIERILQMPNVNK